jgi:uncharacterized membrane protein
MTWQQFNGGLLFLVGVFVVWISVWGLSESFGRDGMLNGAAWKVASAALFAVAAVAVFVGAFLLIGWLVTE